MTIVQEEGKIISATPNERSAKMVSPPRHLVEAIINSMETTQALVKMCHNFCFFSSVRYSNVELFCRAKLEAEQILAAFSCCAGYILEGLTNAERQTWNNIVFKCSSEDDVTLNKDDQKTIVAVGLQLEKLREENSNLRSAVFKDNGVFISKENFKKIEDAFFHYDNNDHSPNSFAERMIGLLQDIESGELHNERKT